MPPLQNPLEEHAALKEFWEKVDLVIYLILIAIVTPEVARIAAQAYQSDGLLRRSLKLLERTISVTHEEFALFAIAAYAGLVFLLLFDEMKWLQGAMLGIASVIGFVVLRSQGVLTTLSPIGHLHVIAAGFASAFVAGGGLSIRTESAPYEFRRATSMLFWTVAGIVGLSFVEYQFAYENPLVTAGQETIEANVVLSSVRFAGQGLLVETAASVTFLFGAYMFTSYEAQQNIFVIGIQRAGKTLLAGALYFAEDDDPENVRLNPTAPMSRLVTSLRANVEGFGNDEYTGPNDKDEYYLLRFRTKGGELFKKYVQIDVLDYAGEYIDKALAEMVARMVPRSRLSMNYLVLLYEKIAGLPDLPEQAEDLDPEEVRRVMAKQIVHSDTLVVIVDSGSLLSSVPYGDDDYEAQQDLDEYIDTYVQLLRHVDESILAEKEVVLVATKADYLYQLYRKESLGMDFFTWVNYFLLEQEEGRQKIAPLLNQAQVDRVYPVYYELDHEASMVAQEPLPQHPIDVKGNDLLLERLKEGA
ncbi:hypothetical protein [Haloarcula amylolytica]|uniref:hypothetical protein n=1 Tax=Haloarcula amylolytica TaxID=396317 RepID=UPI003C756C25